MPRKQGVSIKTVASKLQQHQDAERCEDATQTTARDVMTNGNAAHAQQLQKDAIRERKNRKVQADFVKHQTAMR